MKIILVRHGKHESGIHNGKLLKEGKKQAKLLALKLKKVRIAEFYSSDLKRAKETSDILEKELNTPLVVTPVLREWDSKTIKENRKKWKRGYKDNFNRLKKFINKITKNKEVEGNILVVAHGQLNKLIMAILLDLEIKKTIPFMQDNTCIDVLEWHAHFKNWRLLLLNDTSHLDQNLNKLNTKYRHSLK